MELDQNIHQLEWKDFYKLDKLMELMNYLIIKNMILIEKNYKLKINFFMLMIEMLIFLLLILQNLLIIFMHLEDKC